MKQFFFSQTPDHAIVAYLVKRYFEVAGKPLGRTILQKLCYLSKANGVPVSLHFEIHHYGPFSVDLFRVTDALLVDSVIQDQNPEPSQSSYVSGPTCDAVLRRQRSVIRKQKKVLDQIVGLFQGMSPTQMELITTTHYISCSGRSFGKVKKENIIDTVFRIKGGKFTRPQIKTTFEVLESAGLLTWSPRSTA